MRQSYKQALAVASLLLTACLSGTKAVAQDAITDTLKPSEEAPMTARLTRQVHFPKTVPAGDYSGITALPADRQDVGGNLYAVVSDKADGFFVFRILIDSIDGHIVSVTNEGFSATGDGPRDAEGICRLPHRETLLIVGEGDNKIKEYHLDGSPTGRELALEQGDGNQGYESLTYNELTGRLWTCTEGALPHDRDSQRDEVLLRLQSFDADFQPQGQYVYWTDQPQKQASTMRNYAFGVSELLALDDGSLLVLEREFAVPHAKIGATVINKIYRVKPQPLSLLPVGGSQANDTRLHKDTQRDFQTAEALSHKEGHSGDKTAETLPHGESRRGLPKTLVAQWETRLTLTSRSLANYEGMCLGPTLADGTQTVILVSDSQSRAGGVLRDWFRTLLLSKDF